MAACRQTHLQACLVAPAAPVAPVVASLAGQARQPWLEHLRPALDGVLAACQAGASVAQALNRAIDQPLGAALGQAGPGHNAPMLDAGPLRFVPQAALPAGEAYEAFIHRTAQVPTRDNAHDLFNGLTWLTQPVLKRRLNALQAAELARTGAGPLRGALRDALTQFDESGALLAAPAPLVQALQARDWTALFITHRGLWPQARLQIVGHALLDQLCTAPRKGLTAKVMVLESGLGAAPDAHLGSLCAACSTAQVDAHMTGQAMGQLAAALAADTWSGKPFCPLPVLGVPGWWPGNDHPSFYDDAAVFRPPRHRAQPALTTAGHAGKNPSIDK